MTRNELIYRVVFVVAIAGVILAAILVPSPHPVFSVDIGSDPKPAPSVSTAPMLACAAGCRPQYVQTTSDDGSSAKWSIVCACP